MLRCQSFGGGARRRFARGTVPVLPNALLRQVPRKGRSANVRQVAHHVRPVVVLRVCVKDSRVLIMICGTGPAIYRPRAIGGRFVRPRAMVLHARRRADEPHQPNCRRLATVRGRLPQATPLGVDATSRHAVIGPTKALRIERAAGEQRGFRVPGMAFQASWIQYNGIEPFRFYASESANCRSQPGFGKGIGRLSRLSSARRR
jgi:hypothetical protein